MLFEQILWFPPAAAVGNAFTFTVYVAVAVIGVLHATVLVTVIVKVTAVPASPAAAVYTGAVVVPPDVIVPDPFSVHAIVPLLELAPLTVAVLFEQILWFPPAAAVGNGSIVTVNGAATVVHEVDVTVSDTDTVPTPDAPHVTLIVLVEPPEFIVPPDTDHTYVLPEFAVTE